MKAPPLFATPLRSVAGIGQAIAGVIDLSYRHLAHSNPVFG
jgi:hypothetical protein